QAETLARQSVARELATQAKAKELAEKFAKELIAAAKGAESLKDATDALVADYLAKSPLPKLKDDTHPGMGDDARPEVEISPPFSVLQNPMRTALRGDVASLAFGLEKPDQLHGEPIATADGAAVLQLKSKEPAKRA